MDGKEIVQACNDGVRTVGALRCAGEMDMNDQIAVIALKAVSQAIADHMMRKALRLWQKEWKE